MDKVTDIVCVIDRSGSMSLGWTETIQAFKDLIDEQRNLPGRATITIAFFDTEYDMVYDHVALEDVQVDKIFSDFGPRGLTALNDAICKTLIHYEEKDYKADGRIAIIVTDGAENASTQYTKDQVDSLKDIREKNGWEFVMMGDSEAQMQAYHIKPEYRTVFDKNSVASMNSSYAATTLNVANARTVINNEANTEGNS